MERRIFEDPIQPAFFEAAKYSFQIIPQNNPISNRVEFVVIGKDIDGALQELYANKSVGALDFIKALKSFRASIFALKGRSAAKPAAR